MLNPPPTASLLSCHQECQRAYILAFSALALSHSHTHVFPFSQALCAHAILINCLVAARACLVPVCYAQYATMYAIGHRPHIHQCVWAAVAGAHTHSHTNTYTYAHALYLSHTHIHTTCVCLSPQHSLSLCFDLFPFSLILFLCSVCVVCV